jgi:MarR family transcriptional regulator, organic hydroperoxide resistance regulator
MSDDAAADDFQTAFWAAKHALSTATGAAFARHGVHEGQQFILRCLWAQDGMTPGEIARSLGLATPTVTRAATRMEAAGLLRRAPHPGDRRLVRLLLTERGRSLEHVIAAETDKLTQRALSTFGAAEREAIIRALRAIRRNLSTELPAGLAPLRQGSRISGSDTSWRSFMSTGALVGIIIALIVVAAIAAVASVQVKRTQMRRKFGPEYDRLAKDLGSRRKAEAELIERRHRVEGLGIHPLTAEQQASYAGQWTAIQERFVDAPAEAVSAADALIWDVMRDRGYPADRNTSMEALSVYHGRPLEGYRQAQDVRADSASTEQLRESLIRCRTLFDDLLGSQNGRGRLRRELTTQNTARTANPTR